MRTSDEQRDGKERIADMVVVHPLQGTIYYEFKSVKNLPPHDFVGQFSKDLSRPNFNINNLKWVFDGKKIQAKDLQRLRGKLDEIVTDRIAVRHGFSDANAMFNELFKNVFKIH